MGIVSDATAKSVPGEPTVTAMLNAAAALVNGVTGGDDRPVLSPKTPLESARELLARHYNRDMRRTLHHHGWTFYVWRGTCYAEIAEEEIRTAIAHFMDRASRLDRDKLVPFEVTPRHVSDVLAMLRTATQLPGDVRPPAWLDGKAHPPAAEFFAVANGLVHLPTRTLYPHSPDFFL